MKNNLNFNIFIQCFGGSMKKKNILKKIIGVFLFLIIVGSILTGNYLVNYALARQGDGGNRKVKPLKIIENPIIKENKTLQEKKNREFLDKNTPQEINIKSFDGLNLKRILLFE